MKKVIAFVFAVLGLMAVSAVLLSEHGVMVATFTVALGVWECGAALTRIAAAIEATEARRKACEDRKRVML